MEITELGESKDVVDIKENSLESYIESVWREVRSNISEIFEEEYSASEIVPISTYDRYAVLRTEDGKYWRLEVERNNYEAEGIEGVEELSVSENEVGQEDLVDSYVDKYLQNVAEDSELADEAFSRVVNIMVDDWWRNTDGFDSYKKLKKVFESPSIWRDYAGNKWKEIRKFLHGSLGDIEESTPKQRFSELYSGRVSEEELEKGEEALDNAISEVEEKIDEFAEEVNRSIEAYQTSRRDDLITDIGEDLLLSRIRKIMESLRSDLELVSEIVEDVKEEGVRVRARVFDEIAEQYEKFSVMSNFVGKLADTIFEGATDEQTQK